VIYRSHFSALYPLFSTIFRYLSASCEAENIGMVNSADIGSDNLVATDTFVVVAARQATVKVISA
jgi:hypothetical protein